MGGYASYAPAGAGWIIMQHEHQVSCGCNGLTFSLWSVHANDFVPGGTGHRAELSFMVADEDTVQDLRAQWGNLGVEIEQDLHEAVFGLTFVARDPDGHRIRVCIPDKGE